MKSDLIQDHGCTHEDPQHVHDNYVSCRKCGDEVPPTQIKWGKCMECYNVQLTADNFDVEDDE